MRREFKNYYGLKRYLTFVAQNNKHNINFDNYNGLEMIYNYLHQHEDKVSYNFKNKTLSWASADPSIATVSSDGKITGVKPGNTTITVSTTDGSISADSVL